LKIDIKKTSLLCLVFIVSCTNMIKYPSSSSKISLAQLQEAIHLAKLSSLVYEKPDVFHTEISDLTLFGREKALKQNWFLQTLDDKQVIGIQGTANLENVLVDANYFEKDDKLLGVKLHAGFRESAYLIYNKVEAELDKSKPITFTGHSLGAATATIMGMIAHAKGFRVKVINFGQPMVTDKEGSKKYKDFPNFRVVNQSDPVPRVPPVTLLSLIMGEYTHFGNELHLQGAGKYEYYLTGSGVGKLKNQFWRRIGELDLKNHFIKNYIANLNSISSRIQSAN